MKRKERRSYLSEHNVERKHLEEKVTRDWQNLLLLLILFLDVAISRVVKVQSEKKKAAFTLNYIERIS